MEFVCLCPQQYLYYWSEHSCNLQFVSLLHLVIIVNMDFKSKYIFFSHRKTSPGTRLEFLRDFLIRSYIKWFIVIPNIPPALIIDIQILKEKIYIGLQWQARPNTLRLESREPRKVNVGGSWWYAVKQQQFAVTLSLLRRACQFN